MKRSLLKSFLSVSLCLALLLTLLIIPASAFAAEKVEITISHFFIMGDGRYELGQESLRKFREANPDITVTEEALAHDLYFTKLQTLGVTDDLPDVFLMKGAWSETFVNAGTISPWTEELQNNPEWGGNFTEGALANHIYDGEVYSIPFTVDLNSLFYYNGQMLADNGLTVPTTYEEFLTMCDTLNAAGIIPMALGNKDQWLVPTASLSCWTAMKGGRDFQNDLCFGDAKYTDAPYVGALTALKELVDKNAFNSDFNSIDNYQMYGLVGNGEAASFIAGSWAAQTYLDTATEEIGAVTHVAPMPIFADGAGTYGYVAGGSGWGWQINNKLTGAKRDAAIALVKALSGKEWAKDEIELASIIPPVAEYTYDAAKVTPLLSEILAIAQNAVLTPVFDQVLSTEISDPMNKTTQDVLAGGLTPEEAAEQLQAIKDRISAE